MEWFSFVWFVVAFPTLCKVFVAAYSISASFCYPAWLHPDVHPVLWAYLSCLWNFVFCWNKHLRLINDGTHESIQIFCDISYFEVFLSSLSFWFERTAHNQGECCEWFFAALVQFCKWGAVLPLKGLISIDNEWCRSWFFILHIGLLFESLAVSRWF